MDVHLNRFAFCPEDTQGRLIIGNWRCWTIEQPWVRWNYPGGKPFESCVPDGKYDLVPFLRPSGERAFALVNERLGVYFAKADMPGGRGRFLCLIHGANFASDVQGCIAPGKNRLIHSERLSLMVTDSQNTMREIRNRLGWRDGHTLTIHAATGAIDTPLAPVRED